MGYSELVAAVMHLKNERGSKYRTEPRTIVPIVVLEGQVYLKAVRGYEKISNEDKIEEYKDCINYCFFVIERLQHEIDFEKELTKGLIEAKI